MIVVADTTPLRHLIAIGEADLLRRLFGVVTVPVAVWNELQAESTPNLVKRWVAAAPAWIAIRSPGEPAAADAELSSLDPGELEAIQLAIELNADVLLIDDREGRAVAMRMRLPVTGTLGVLERADTMGLLANFAQTIADLEASGFFMSARLRDAALLRHGRQYRTPE
jgi:predicted nucleic acid-binding protein